jgi:hypothetical protein
MTILKTTKHHEGQEIEIFVSYDPKENTVDSIKSINLKTHGRSFPIGNFMMHIDEFEQAINKIIDNTDWREIYRSMGEGDDVEAVNSVFATLHRCFKPVKY